MRLSARLSAVGDLFTPMPMALPTLLKHIRVLEDCGLVATKRSDGRGCEVQPMRCAQPMPGSRNNGPFWRQGSTGWKPVLDLQAQEKKNARRKRKCSPRLAPRHLGARREIVLTRVVAAPRELVFRAWPIRGTSRVVRP